MIKLCVLSLENHLKNWMLGPGKPFPGADFTKGLRLKQVFWLSQGLKSKTLVLARSGT